MKDLLFKRRSIRKYTSAPIEQEKIDQLLSAALLSPTSRNNRPWEFIVVDDSTVLDKLSVAKSGSQFLKGAPLGIVVLADSAKSDVWVEDTAIACIIIQLTAQSLGLGSCWVQLRKRMHNEEISAEQYVRGVLQIPEHLQVEAIISLGYPDETRPEHSSEELLWDKVHRNIFGRK